MKNARYLAYCKSKGFENDPDGMLIKDRNEYPGGCMTGFILWVQEMIYIFKIKFPHLSGEGFYGDNVQAFLTKWLGHR